MTQNLKSSLLRCISSFIPAISICDTDPHLHIVGAILNVHNPYLIWLYYFLVYCIAYVVYTFSQLECCSLWLCRLKAIHFYLIEENMHALDSPVNICIKIFSNNTFLFSILLGWVFCVQLRSSKKQLWGNVSNISNIFRRMIYMYL